MMHTLHTAYHDKASGFVYTCLHLYKWAATQECVCIEDVAQHVLKLKACAEAQFYCRILPFFCSFTAA